MLDSTSTLDRFYQIMDNLEEGTGGLCNLGQLKKYKNIPSHGVYFFFEQGEVRAKDPSKQRIVRIGTHGTRAGSKSILKGRLSQHKSGTTQGSVFRLYVKEALHRSNQHPAAEEIEVSNYMHANFSFLALNAPLAEDRKFIERNAIGLLAEKERASEGWLGNHCRSIAIRYSYLWNIRDVEHGVEDGFLERLEALVRVQVGS